MENKITKRDKKRKFPLGCLFIFVILVFILIGSGAIIVFVYLFGGDFTASLYDSGIEETSIESGAYDEKIAVIPIKGLITSQEAGSGLFEMGGTTPQVARIMLEKALYDEDVKAVVIDMDSAGGEVLASDLIYQKVKDVNQEKPVVVWMGNYGASGGYYIAAAAEEIVVHSATMTGSIGVIAQITNFDELYEKLGIRTITFKSSEYKDDSALWGTDSEELRGVYQDLIDETYEKFVTVVAEGREMDKKSVYSLADGRIYSGMQAVDKGLADFEGVLDDAIERASVLAELENPEVVRYDEYEGLLDNYLNLLTRKFEVVLFPELSGAKSSIDVQPGIHLYYLASPLSTNSY